MHFSFWEKTGFAALVTAWVVWGSVQIGDMLVQAEPLEEPAYVVAGVEQEGGAAEAEPKQAAPDTMTLLASIDPSEGESVFNKCKACHTIEQGGANRVGPNLYNTVGKDIAGNPEFGYSDALAGLDGEWTYEKLDGFLESPRDYAPGTKMSFAGLSKPEDRAAIIAYMRSYTDNPPALPEPKPMPAAESTEQASAESPEQASAEGGEQMASGGDEQAAAGGGLAAALANGSADDGKKVYNQCRACHTIDKGGANRVGPNLYNVVGAKIAHVEDFNYSGAVAEHGGEWTYENLDAWLESPNDFISGNKMTYRGIKDLQKRADLILYLRENSENPPPLP